MSSLDTLREKILEHKAKCEELKTHNEALVAQMEQLKIELKSKDEEIESIIAKIEELLD